MARAAESRDAAVPLRAADFDEIRRLARSTFGLDLKSGKEQLVAARLSRMLRAGGFGSYRDLYRHILTDTTGEALAAMIDALATNHTAFLRESAHFDFLRDHVLPGLRGRDSVEIWCAACATGEEVWTLACLLNDAFPAGRCRITATDISRKALAVAERAVYGKDRCSGLPAAWLSRYFAAEGGAEPSYRVRAGVRSQVAFSRLNLMEPVSWPRRYPVVFCRNVMIYFDAATQDKVVEKLAANLEPGGYLFVGHAESLSRSANSLEYIRPAIYRKPSEREAAWSRSW